MPRKPGEIAPRRFNPKAPPEDDIKLLCDLAYSMTGCSGLFEAGYPARIKKIARALKSYLKVRRGVEGP